jgi:hypothetical protein
LRQGVVLATVTEVVDLADRPMRMTEVHRAVETKLDAKVPRSTINEALSTHARGFDPRFRRVGHGVYEAAVTARDG